MSMSIERVKNYLDSKNMKYAVTNEGKTIRLGFGGLKNAGSLEILVYFDSDDQAIGVRCFSLLTISESLKPAMYKLCSQLNTKYRWTRFFVDESDNTLTVAIDAVTQLDSVGAETYELVMRMVHIIEDAYPTLMKAKFA